VKIDCIAPHNAASSLLSVYLLAAIISFISTPQAPSPCWGGLPLKVYRMTQNWRADATRPAQVCTTCSFLDSSPCPFKEHRTTLPKPPISSLTTHAIPIISTP
jgi:hypothetical protein